MNLNDGVEIFLSRKRVEISVDPRSSVVSVIRVKLRQGSADHLARLRRTMI